jgi:DNA polymerase III subunit delta
MTVQGITLSFPELLADREKRTFFLYYLEGDDEFLIKEAVNHLGSHLLAPEYREFNFHTLVATKETKAHEVMTLCLEFPVMSPLRVVYLEGVHRLSAEEKDRLSKNCAVPIKGTALILSTPQGDKKERLTLGKKLESLLKSMAFTILCSMNERETEEWITHILKRQGFEIRQDAIPYLRKRIGQDLWLLSIELSKLKAYGGSKKIISRQEIDAITTQTPQAQMYQITENIMKGNTDAVMKTFYELTATVEPSMGTLSYINRFFINILECRKMVRETGSVREAARILKKAEYGVKKSAELASQLTGPVLQKIMEACLQADLSIKKGKEKRVIYEVLLIHLCSLFKKTGEWNPGPSSDGFR